jgi:CelD/BcsL family acetyltransferase involved in cellulose biosynthesis
MSVSALLRSSPPKAAAMSRCARPDAARAFASVETIESIDAARCAWAEVTSHAPASPYQDFDFAQLWLKTIGVAHGVRPLIVVARDAVGEVVALLPLGARALGPLRVAVFLGGTDANFNLGLFRREEAWSPQEIARLLAAAARAAQPHVDAFLFNNQPRDWQGAPNPLAAAPNQPSPSFAYKGALPGDFAAWLNAHASKEAQKKLRKKAKRLEVMGPVVHRRAVDAAEVERLLAAFFAQKSARMRARGITNAYERPEARAFLSGLARCGLETGAPKLELHGLSVGNRVVATFGALAGGDRLSGLFLSYDADPEIARSSPGELIVQTVVREAIARGFKTFDLGVGEARYKGETCEAEEPLFDSAFGVDAFGRAAAWAFLAKRRLKRRVNRSPRLIALFRRLRGVAAWPARLPRGR